MSILEELLGQWLSELTVEDLPESAREIAQVIGVEAAVRLIVYYGGTAVYIPKANTILRERRDERIAREFAAGADVDELVRRYGLCKSRVYQIIEEQRTRRDADRRQMPLFAS